MSSATGAARGFVGLGLAAFTVACAAATTGCGSSSKSDGSGTSGSTSSVAATTATGSTTAALNTNAHAVTTAPLGVAAGSVTFATNPEVQRLQVGDVIVAATAAVATTTPYLRTITAIAADSPGAGQTTFTTTDATLDDLFASADIEQTGALTTGASLSAAPIDAGDPNILGLRGLPGLTTPLDLQVLPSGTKLWSVGSNGGGGSFGLTGGAVLDTSESSLAVSGGVDFEYTKLPGFTLLPQHIRLVFSGALNIVAGAKLTTTGAVSYSLPTHTYGGELVLGTILFEAGPIPIPVVVTLDFEADATLSLSTSSFLLEAVSAAFDLSAGVDYTASGGATGVFTHTALVNYQPFTVTGNVAGTFTLYPLEPTLHFLVLGLAGPSVSFSPYIGMTVANPSSGPATVSGIYGLRSFLSGDLEVFNEKLAGLSITLFNLTGSFPGCTDKAVVCSGGPIVGTSGH
jgi:hypothetical protein